MRTLPLALSSVALLLTATGCGSTAPATRDSLCQSFDALGKQFSQGNGVFGNPLFHAVKSTGGVAQSYPSDSGVQADGKALSGLGSRDSLSGGDLMNASTHIAAVCGHPLGIG